MENVIRGWAGMAALTLGAALAGCGGSSTGGGKTCVPTTCAAAGQTCGSLDDGCGHTLSCGTSCGPMSALHTNGRYLDTPDGRHVVLRGVNSISMGHIVGPKNGPAWFPLTVEQYVDAFVNDSWKTRAVRMLFNSFPSSDLGRDSGVDPSNLAWYPVPFSYDPATLPPAWQASHAYTVGDRVYNNTLVWRCTTAGTSGSSGGPHYVGQDVTDGTAHWTVVNPTVITDADWSAYTAAVLFRSVDYAISKGLYVAICLYDFSDPATEPTLQARHASFWGRLSRSKYANHPQVLFDLHNEIERADNWTSVKPLLQETVDMIRGNGAENVILVPSPGWAASTKIAVEDPLTGTNLAYTMHRYLSYWDGDLNTLTLPALQSDKPVFVSEFGDADPSYTYWQTYPVGTRSWTATGGYYLSLQSLDAQGSYPSWAAGTYATGDRVFNDHAVWEVVTGGPSTIAPSGNGHDRGQSIDYLDVGDGLRWKCLANRDHDPATSPTWWQAGATADPWFRTEFLPVLDPHYGSTNPSVGMLAWSVSSDWAPGMFTSNDLTTPNAYGAEVMQWLSETQSADVP
jgi:hypothetical protein